MRLGLREDAVELHDYGNGTNFRGFEVFSAKGFFEPSNARLFCIYYEGHRFFERLRDFLALVVDAMAIFYDAHGNAHELSHRLIPVRQVEAPEKQLILGIAWG